MWNIGDVITVGIVVAVVFGLQFWLSSFQMKNFNNEFVKLRRKGKVAIGRKAGGFNAGAIVMFQIDDDGQIREGRKIEGTTFLARVKDFPDLNGRNVATLTRADGPRGHRNLARAIEDAALTYNKYVNGEVLEDTPSPLGKVGKLVFNKAR